MRAIVLLLVFLFGLAAPAIVVGLAAPIPAQAQKPVREVLPTPGDVDTNACGFPVRVHTVGTTIRKTWFDEQGNPVRAVETYPGSKYVLTNLETQKQIQFTIVGPAFYEFRPDGSFTVMGTGPWGWWRRGARWPTARTGAGATQS